MMSMMSMTPITNMTTDTKTPILLSPPHLSGAERHFVEEAFRTNWIAPLGPNVDAFEREFAAQLSASPTPMYCCATSSGTAAIHLGLLTLGVCPGDIVLCSSFTFVATANPIRQVGAEPVFIDSDEESWNMSPVALRRALQSLDAEGVRPRAVVTVDLYGQGCNYGVIEPVCQEWNVPILEDAAEALGATVDGRPCGSFGSVAAFSFNGNKIITTSGGGMLAARSVRAAEFARFLATQARDHAPHYEHSITGFNYRLSNICAGIGRGQLLVLDERVARRREIVAHYKRALGAIDGIEFMPEPSWSRSTHWLTTLTIDHTRAGCSRDELLSALAAERIEARPAWKPMHMQPLFADCRMFEHNQGCAPVCERLFRDGLCLPSGSSMSDADVARVIQVCERALSPARLARGSGAPVAAARSV